MKIAKTKLVYTDKNKRRQVIASGTEITKDHAIPDMVLKRFEKLDAVGKPSAEEQLAAKAREEAEAKRLADEEAAKKSDGKDDKKSDGKDKLDPGK